MYGCMNIYLITTIYSVYFELLPISLSDSNQLKKSIDQRNDMFNAFREWYYQSQAYQNDIRMYNDNINYADDGYEMLVNLMKYLSNSYQIILAVDEMCDSHLFIHFQDNGGKEYYIVNICGVLLDNVNEMATIISSIDNQGCKQQTGTNRAVRPIKLTPLKFKEARELFLQYYNEHKFNVSDNQYTSLKKAFYLCYALPRTFAELIKKALCNKRNTPCVNVSDWLFEIAQYVRVQYIDNKNNLSPMAKIQVCYMYMYIWYICI